MPRAETALTTASAPAATPATDGGSVTSAPVSRVAAVTAWPRCASSAAMRVPIMPVAPKTTMFIWVAPVCVCVWTWCNGRTSGSCARGRSGAVPRALLGDGPGARVGDRREDGEPERAADLRAGVDQPGGQPVLLR